MKSAPVFENDERRVASVRSYEILNALPTDAFDTIARLVASICASPVALVTLIDETHNHFISHIGLERTSFPREITFCAHAIANPTEIMIVPDASADPRFCDHPLVLGEPYVRFYAGMPLLSSDGYALGSLCVLDVVPRDLAAPARETLRLAARCVMALLEERRTSLQLGAALTDARVNASRIALLESVAINAHEGVMVLELQPHDGRLPMVAFANAAISRLTGWTPERFPVTIDAALWAAIASRDGRAAFEAAIAANAPYVTEALVRGACGGEKLLELRFTRVSDTEAKAAARVLVFVSDLTDRRRADAVERRAETVIARNGELAAEIERRRDVERRLSFAAAHDSLTDLPNRSYFIQRLRARFDVARRRADRVPFGVMFVDIDRFKAVNDSLGHMRGDELLVTLARRLQGCVREHDVVARLGGDEFTVLVDSAADRATIGHLAERIGRAIAAPVRLGRTDVNVSASIGIVLDEGTHATAEDLLRDADIAMFHAKARGRNRHEFFREDLRARAVSEARLEKALRTALERREFRLAYQPIVALGDPAFPVMGFEALLRWESPFQSEIGTTGIIAAAEAYGLVVEIGAWAIDEVCRQLARWKTALPTGARQPYATVNISPRQLIERDFVAHVDRAIRTSEIAPADLALELTESAMMHEPDVVASTVARLRSGGTPLYLDDFGTGYASLSYLRRFNVDWLKIDRSFVSGHADGLADEAIVDGIISFAHRLGIGTVAEGVETQKQVERLVALGCESAQGYAFGPPMPPELATEMLMRAHRGKD